MTMPDDAFQWQTYGLALPPDPELPPPHTLFQLGLPSISTALVGAGPDWTVTVSVPITLLGTIDEDEFQAMLLFEDLRPGATSDTGFPAAPPALGSGWPDGADTWAGLVSPGGSGDYTLTVNVDAGPYADIDDLRLFGVQVRHHYIGPTFIDKLYQADPTGNTGTTVPANGWFYFGEKVANTPDDTDEPYALYSDPGPPTEGWAAHETYTPGLVSLAVSYGAPDAVSVPRPLEAVVELAIDVAGDCPAAGERFRLALSDAAAAVLEIGSEDAVLFTGEVTDPTIDPRRGLHRVIAAGALGRHFRRTLPALGWSTQTETDRVERIMDHAEIEVGEIHAGTTLLAAPQNDDTAGALLDKVTSSTGGAVVEQPTGAVDYLGPDHRRGGAIVLTLDASNIDNALTWSQHVDDILNEVEVTYASGTVLVQDPASIDSRGVYPGRIGTELVSTSAAYSLGQLVVGRRSEPVWQLPDLEVDLMHMVDEETRGQLLMLRHGDLIEVTNIPPPHAYTGDVKLYVEGWSTTVVRPAEGTPWRWKHVLKVSDRTLSGVSIRWMDVDASLAWLDVDPEITWLDVATIIDDEQLLGEPDSGLDLLDGGAPDTSSWDRTIDAGDPDDTATLTFDGGTP